MAILTVRFGVLALFGLVEILQPKQIYQYIFFSFDIHFGAPCAKKIFLSREMSTHLYFELKRVPAHEDQVGWCPSFPWSDQYKNSLTDWGVKQTRPFEQFSNQNQVICRDTEDNFFPSELCLRQIIM